MSTPHRVGLLALAVSAWISIAAGQAATIEAGALLIKMEQRYAHLSSYQDTGIVLVHDPKKSSPDELPFQTTFRRPDGFRFEWTRHHPYEPLRHIITRSVIWARDGRAFIYRSRPEVTEEKALSLAIASGTGVSRGSAHRVIRMLLPEVGGFTFSELLNPEIVGEEAFDGAACIRLKANHPRGNAYELWIGKDDLLLRRLWTRSNGFSDTEEIRRNIQVNAPIADGALEQEPR